MMFVRFPRRLSLVALAVVLGAGGFGVSLAYTGSAAALEVPTVTTPVPVPTPTATVPVPVPTVPVPTPTVPVPTPTVPVPAPTVPAPTPTVPVPTPTLPAPTPTVPTPALPGTGPAPGVPLPTSPSVPVPTSSSPVTVSVGGTAGSAPARSVILLPSAGSGAAGGGASGAAYAPAAAAAPLERSAATTAGIRVANVRGRKDVVKVSFRLPRRSRVVVSLRGPLPSCTRVARFVIQGRRGSNTFRFDGRAGGRPLAEGSYLLGIRPAGRTVTRWGALEVGSAGVRALPRAAANSAVDYCSSAAAAAAAAAGPFGIVFLAATGPEAAALIASGREAAKSGEGGNPAATPVERPRSAGVLGVQQIEDAANTIHPVFGLAILAIMVGSLIAIVFLVISYLRGEGLGRTPL